MTSTEFHPTFKYNVNHVTVGKWGVLSAVNEIHSQYICLESGPKNVAAITLPEI